MPYSNIDQLPPAVRNNLPVGAQRIFVKAFNSRYSELKPGESEVEAFKIAWGAVKRKYEKRNGEWVLKSEKPGTRTKHRKKAS
jgi:cation transport regulator